MRINDYIINKADWHIVLSLICLLIICSCRAKYIPVESKVDSVIIEKLVKVQLPSDSATIRALLECDENGKVILSWLDVANSKNAQALLTIDSLGNLLAKMKTQQDTVYLPSKEVTVTKEVKVPYPVEKELTRWQKLCVNIGGWAIGIVIITILVVVGRMVYKLKK